jgi:MoaA/NifB/PqqE/SkfB family radical SAM enzyme
MSKEFPDALTTESWVEATHNIARTLGKNVNLVLYGGEPFLQKERIFAITAAAHSHGISVNVITNGSLLSEANFADLWSRGPDILTISLDSVLPEVHDRARGIPGGHEQVLRLIKGLVNYQKNQTRKIVLSLVSVLSKSSLAAAPALVEYAAGLGLDGISFNALSPTLDNRAARDPYFDLESAIPEAEVQSALDALLRLKQSKYRDFIHTTEEDLAVYREYFRAPRERFQKPACNAHRLMMVGSRGEINFCEYMQQHISDKPIGSIRDPLETTLNSALAFAAREKMQKCLEPCGAFGCHRL